MSKSWDELKLTRQFVNALLELGFTYPTDIQVKCIPLIQAGQKVIGIAQTGTGKTAAYLVPILSKLKFAQHAGARSLVLAPTKELVIQIGTQAKALAKYTDLNIVQLYGGVGTKSQMDILKLGADLLIATPGQFLEIYQRGGIKCKLLKTLVIDEADRMMDMNFMPQLRRILEVLPPKQQGLLFSATYPARVEKMASEFIDFPVKIEVTPQSTASSQVTQVIYKIPNFATKLNLLEYLLKFPEYSRIIVFVRTKKIVSSLEKYLKRINVGEVRSIHSNKSQNSRINALADFRNGNVRLLISTDVSSRGIDIHKVSHVINFDVPVLYEDYVHRIGRTGRAFETGIAITFVAPSDEYHIRKIEAIIKEKISISKLPDTVMVENTPAGEAKKIAMEIDRQKQREDPTFQGAFHTRKR